MSINNDAIARQSWTNQKLIDMSENLGQAYCPGLKSAKSDSKADSWTAQRYINLSKSLSSAYGVDFQDLINRSLNEISSDFLATTAYGDRYLKPSNLSKLGY